MDLQFNKSLLLLVWCGLAEDGERTDNGYILKPSIYTTKWAAEAEQENRK